jgi:hypothetical protein
MVDPTPINKPIIKADGATVRANRKHIVKQNTDKEKKIVGKLNLAKHNLIHGTSSGSINRGDHRG